LFVLPFQEPAGQSEQTPLGLHRGGLNQHKHRIVVMGVSGAGKTTVGQALAADLRAMFRDGDDLHPQSNIEKMRQGIALNDTDRWTWLELVANSLRRDAPIVFACSALRRVYRDHLRLCAGRDITFVYLHGAPDLIAQRLAQRQHDYMPPRLLASQFETLEPPPSDEALSVPITLPVDAQVAMIVAALAKA
jgi:gluconokinase